MIVLSCSFPLNSIGSGEQSSERKHTDWAGKNRSRSNCRDCKGQCYISSNDHSTHLTDSDQSKGLERMCFCATPRDAQKLLLVGYGNHMGCWGSNLDLLHARQKYSPWYYCSGLCMKFLTQDVWISHWICTYSINCSYSPGFMSELETPM